MPYFSRSSIRKRNHCCDDIQILFNEVIKTFDCKIICSYRDKEAQEKAFDENRSKLHFPQSKHNILPTAAIDIAPYPIKWTDKDTFYYFGGYVLGIAIMLKKFRKIHSNIRWGGDWNRNHDLKDQTFFDLIHFEII